MGSSLLMFAGPPGGLPSSAAAWTWPASAEVQRSLVGEPGRLGGAKWSLALFLACCTH